MKIIVTGGAGLIGSNLCLALLEKGHEVVATDNFAYGIMENLNPCKDFKGFSFLKADVLDKDFLSEYRGEADAVAHLAALKIPRYGKRLDTLTVNSMGSYNAFELARRLKAKLVFGSTSDVYGKNTEVPLKEEDLVSFAGPEIRRWAYAVSKFYEEHLGFAYAEEYDLPMVCLRFFATYGPHQHRSWRGGPTPVFIEKALQKEPITIHGDGKQTRCMCYVSDTVDGIVRCIENPKADGHVFNIGNPKEISIIDYARMVYELIYPGDEPRFEFVPYETFGKYEDIRCRVPDISKIQSLLGFQPRVSAEQGLRKTIDWQRQFY